MILFDGVIDCLDACLIIFDKTHIMCHISKLIFDVLC